MYLIHKLKAAQHVIPLDAAKALEPTAYAVYRERHAGTEKHTGVGIQLISVQLPEAGKKKAKYQNHSFELLISPAHIDQFITALVWAKKQFEATEEQPVVPVAP